MCRGVRRRSELLSRDLLLLLNADPADLQCGLLGRGNSVGQTEAMVFQVECPFCGEPGVVEIEPADFEPGENVLVQDCEVCCRPWTVRIQMDPNGATTVSADRD